MRAPSALLDLESALTEYGPMSTLLAGAAIQGMPRTPVAPLQAVVLDDGSARPLWLQRRRGRRTRLVTAGAPFARPPSPSDYARIIATLGHGGKPDIVHLFVTLADRTPQLDVVEVPGYVCHLRHTSYRYVLPLGDDYEAFVQGLGKHSRRNIRLYHRNAEAAGLSFAFSPQAPRTDAASKLERAAVGAMTVPKPKSAGRLGELDAFLRIRNRPFHSTIRAPDGRLLSVSTGFRCGDNAYLVYQCNHKDHADANLALTHRSLLIRALIEAGVRTFVFPNGINDVLRNACRRDHAIELLAVRQGLLADWRVRRWLRREPGHPAARFLSAAHAAAGEADTEEDAAVNAETNEETDD